MKPALYLVPILAVTVFLLIRAEFAHNKRQIYIFKPISTLLVIAMAALSITTPSWDRTYTISILIGLVFSLGGDIALMFQEERKWFVAGLVSFLLGHIAYSVVFLVMGGFVWWQLVLVVGLVAFGIWFYRLMSPNLGKMKMPVIAYMIIISLMVLSAVGTFASAVLSSTQAWMIVLGALLFFSSDVILAANRFWKPWEKNRYSLALYYGGQMLLALAANWFL